MRLTTALLLTICALRAYAEEINDLCTSVEGSSSCGQCIKQHPQCAWCKDPHSKAASRCMEKSLFTADTCNPNYVYTQITEMKISPHNQPLESLQRDQKTVVQLEPQQVVLRLKPGDSLEVPFKYLHKRMAGHTEIKDFQILTSDFANTGVDIKFYITCKGEEVEARRCADIADNEVVQFKAKVNLQKCTGGGDIAVSVGVYGPRSVSAMFITPLCGCECEKVQQQEKNSPLCRAHGDLICGQCQCQPGRGGSNCECPLSLYGVETPEQLTDKCREYPGAPICGGAGTCNCGSCVCNNPAITGKFCSCDHKACPTGGLGQQTCSGNGVCECGKCQCEDNWEREDCSCTKETNTCMEGGVLCSGNGKCECGKCVCNNGFTGATCNAQEPIGEESEEAMTEDKEDNIPPVEPEAEGGASEELPQPVEDDDDVAKTDDEEQNDQEKAAEGQTDVNSKYSLTMVVLVTLSLLCRFL